MSATLTGQVEGPGRWPPLEPATEKACTKCKVVKPLADFCRDRQKRDGLNSSCRSCNNSQTLKWRNANLETVRAKQREYHRKNWAQNQINLARTKARHPEREMARILVHRAIRKGQLTKQPCEKCGHPKAQAHHDDYTKPLEVRWLCHPHHMDYHRKYPLIDQQVAS